MVKMTLFVKGIVIGSSLKKRVFIMINESMMSNNNKRINT